ncbi:cell division protein FtsQ/DivIB [Olleya sp. YS]|uniref:cell division protein FtsQ/DivIB n=1 Tax=Olleya sp. YS TaxID=3028318 RepID=UPI0024342FA3|nr:cell division protein FtsQ/DivIB [Olleya sp. YS]WGD35318.1 cell division protein FtsQ/DivIB [Olleya sp. YS]
MKVNWNDIKLLVLLGLVVFLYAFSSKRNAKRTVSKPHVEFLGNNNLFMTQEDVSKLLIQNQQSVTNEPKEILDLNLLETTLNANPIVEFADVYVSVTGNLTAKVKQKTPIARVVTDASYYIDSNGGYMPLSKNYTERVPIVTGFVNKKTLENAHKMAIKIQEDEFLKKHVVRIHQNKNGTIDLKLRQCEFIVKLGSLKQLDKKINNLKAFYLKATKDKTLNNYSKVNLQFGNQVVCTKA